MNAQPYPARLDGRLDPALSRWLWLVKWLLIVPHVVVLFSLWCALTVLTAAAGLAILFTGRYPRAIFDFRPSPITAGMEAASSPPAYRDVTV